MIDHRYVQALPFYVDRESGGTEAGPGKCVTYSYGGTAFNLYGNPIIQENGVLSLVAFSGLQYTVDPKGQIEIC